MWGTSLAADVQKTIQCVKPILAVANGRRPWKYQLLEARLFFSHVAQKLGCSWPEPLLPLGKVGEAERANEPRKHTLAQPARNFCKSHGASRTSQPAPVVAEPLPRLMKCSFEGRPGVSVDRKARFPAGRPQRRFNRRVPGIMASLMCKTSSPCDVRCKAGLLMAS